MNCDAATAFHAVGRLWRARERHAVKGGARVLSVPGVRCRALLCPQGAHVLALWGRFKLFGARRLAKGCCLDASRDTGAEREAKLFCLLCAQRSPSSRSSDACIRFRCPSPPVRCARAALRCVSNAHARAVRVATARTRDRLARVSHSVGARVL
jgi:hypothetical protein